MRVKCVLDSSAVLALIRGEQGAEVVAGLLPSAVISAVNHSELVAVALRNGASQSEIADLRQLLKNIIPFDEELAFLAASLARAIKTAGLSLGDRACLATAQRLNLTAVTADKIWSKIKLPIKIKLIR